MPRIVDDFDDRLGACQNLVTVKINQQGGSQLMPSKWDPTYPTCEQSQPLKLDACKTLNLAAFFLGRRRIS